MTTQAENHLILIDAARAMHERHRQLLAASRESIAVEYEDLNDSLGQTLECVTAFEFPDDSRLVRAEGKNMWQEGAWSATSPRAGEIYMTVEQADVLAEALKNARMHDIKPKDQSND